MRRIYLGWMIAVFGIFGTVYGAYLLVYHFNRGNGLNIYALLLLIFGAIALTLILVLYIITFIQKRKKKLEAPVMEETPIEEPVIEEVVEQPQPKEEEPSEEEPQEEVIDDEIEKEDDYVPIEHRTYHSSPSHSYSTIYVKQVGYGPILRIEGERIVDMRTNTYYRLENNMVTQEGYGPIFEIRGNQIKDAFGGYLYEISGSNINKVFGGFYASISGNYITLYDLSIKYEMTDSLSKRQLLAASALLFGKH